MSDKPVNSKISLIELVLGFLACLSVVLLLIPNDLIKFKKTLIANQHEAHLYSDVSQGGQSQVKWIDKEQQIWQCHLRNQSINPYCSMQLDIVDQDAQGLDLSDYDKMTLWISYTGDADSLRIYLRNRNPKYYKLGDITSTKYNVVEVPVDQLENGLTIDMKNINVADWWLSSRRIPLVLSQPEFDDVLFIEVQTGSQTRQGTHQIQLERIEWEGAWLTQAALYKIIILIWIICIFSILLYRVIILNIELKRNQRYQNELVSINELLNLKNKRFEDLAKTDQLTGLLNRLGIREALYDGMNNWKTYRHPFSFILIDIDHFKQLNDTYGHDTGDEVLQQVAQKLSANIRRTDFLARWGGEEFILVCANTSLTEAKVVSELLREKIASMEIAKVGSITASFGVATMTSADLKTLFNDADKALYQAKAQGRNRVICSTNKN